MEVLKYTNKVKLKVKINLINVNLECNMEFANYMC